MPIKPGRSQSPALGPCTFSPCPLRPVGPAGTRRPTGSERRICGTRALGGCLLLSGEAVRTGQDRRARAVGYAELEEDVTHVVLDRALGDEEQIGDLAVREAVSDQRQHLALARGQRVFGGRAMPARLGQPGDYLARDLRAQ